MSKKRGQLFIISGPSGVGKDSVIAEAGKLGLAFGQVVTTTSRKPRGKEQEGKPYHFVSKRKFEKLIKDKKLLEWAKVYGHYYGSESKEIYRALEKNKIVILKVDPQGARTVKRLVPEAKVIFITPPSLDALEKRLKLRKTDAEAVIKKRLQTAKKEMEKPGSWDYLIVNEEGKLKKAALELKKIVESSSKKRYGRKILFAFLSLLILLGYFSITGLSHLQTKKSVQSFYQDIYTSLIIKKQIYQSQETLNFLPRSVFLAYLINPVERKNLAILDSIFSVNKDQANPSFQEVLVFYQRGDNRTRIVFKLKSPILENWEKFQATIKDTWAHKHPSQVTKTLPDETVVLELIPRPEETEVKEDNHQGKDILILIGEDISLAYARLNDYAILTIYSPISASAQDIQLMIEAEANIKKRANLKAFSRCLGEEPYKLILKDQPFLNKWKKNIKLIKMLNIEEPKIEKCV